MVFDALSKSLNLSPDGLGACIGGKDFFASSEDVISTFNPATGELLGRVRAASHDDLILVESAAHTAFEKWKTVPAPIRAELVYEIAQLLRLHKNDLGTLVSLETGKIKSEGDGEIQEMIDMADMAVGLSRRLYGYTMHSERPNHRMYEQWHPLGVVAVISAFNFPVAVWAWNAFNALICGNTVIWKPSEKAPLCAWAVQQLCNTAMKKLGYEGVLNMVTGAGNIGEALVTLPKAALVSFTGSVKTGRKVNTLCAQMFRKCLLELGGNNAVIVDSNADLQLVLRGVVFAAAGTAGQRCTTTRRLLLHSDVYDVFIQKLIKAYNGITIGNPLTAGVLMGPLIDADAVSAYTKTLETAVAQGGKILYGGETIPGEGFYVKPTIIEAPAHLPIMREETFAPILYVVKINSVAEGVEINNAVSQGLSSSIFTQSMLSSEYFLSVRGSDCGIANVNIGTSGAEIGGAFGGEKETGGGREAGSDAWKAYMRRQTVTINYGSELPLSQGVKFDL